MRLRSQAGREAGLRRGLGLHQEESDRLANGQKTATPGPISKSPTARQPGRPDRVLKAYVAGDDLVMVVPDESERSGVSVSRQRAEHSCFVRREELPGDVRRMIERHHAVLGAADEGDWIRIKWASRGACLNYSEGLEERGIPTFEAGVSPALRWMADNDVAVARPRIAWLDLETDSRVPFSKKEEMRILCWALIGEGDELAERGVLTEDTEAAERDLLRGLWKALDQYDLVAAWNGDRFDFLVLRARTEARGLTVDPRRWLWLDHLELFKRMNMMAAESGEEKQSFALEAIAQAVLGEGKAPIDSRRAWEYWEAGGDRRLELLDYCERDTKLMTRIEDRTGYVELLLTLSEACGSMPDTRGANPTSQAESFLQRLAVKRGHKFPSALGRHGADQHAFKGAYVMEPTARGIVKGVHVGDFSSLYPSIIRAWNMSPETRMKTRTRDSVFAWSPLTGVMFDREREGLLPAAVSELMSLRKEWNSRKAAAPPGTAAWKEADRRSTAYKIAANSFYGVIGLPTSRLFDMQVAESVSQCGVWLIKRTIKEAAARGMDVVYGDTDSVYVAGATREEFERFVEWCNEALYPKMLEEVGCIDPGLINLAYEKEFERIVFVSAKRYCGRYAHFKGTAATDESKPEVKGLEYKRGDAIRLARQMQEEAIDLLVGPRREEKPTVFEDLLARWRRRIVEEPLEVGDVVIGKSLSRALGKYARKKKKDGTWARQQPHIEMARELHKRGRDVGEGAKIEYVVVDGSAKPMKVIPAEDWAGEVNRRSLWESLVAPPSLRLLTAAFPAHDWSGWEKADLEIQGRLL